MRTKQSANLILGLCLLAAAFFSEMVFFWGLFAYLAVAVYLARFSPNQTHTLLLGIVASALVIVGYSIINHSPGKELFEITNRIWVLATIWLGVFIGIRSSRLTAKAERQQDLITSITTEKETAVRKLNDITNDIRAYQEDRKSIENELLKGKRLHDAMAHHFPDGVICVLNKEMKYILADGRGLDELGLHGSELKGERAAIGSGIELKKAFTGESVSFETIINQDSYTVNAVPIPDANNEINEILIVIRNITDRKKLENNLIKALEKEKELNLLKSQFVTMASHKFRTPLSTILSSVFLLENNVEADDQERKSYYDKIKRSVHNLTGLLNDFLSLGKLEEGKVKVEFSETEVKSFFQDFLQEVESIKKAKQRIVFSYHGASSTVMTDQLLLKNILMSLLTNAIEYSSYDAEIQLTVELKIDNLKIKVSDNGIGIPVEEQHQIFKRFYRGQNVNNVEGTGIGLNIAKKYIRLLKGTIEFTSEVNKGTTFITNIPVVTVDILEKQA